jgi:putative hydrolase of the HAD superfamily
MTFSQSEFDIRCEWGEEAHAAATTFRGVQSDLAGLPKSCGSGKELIARGFATDVALASTLNGSTCVPVFGETKCSVVLPELVAANKGIKPTPYSLRSASAFGRGSCPTLSGLSVAIAKEHIVPQAILFDLDDTLTDRMQSIARYAERFRRDFADHLASTAVSTIAAALLTADVRGYRPREEVLRDFSRRLPWRTVPAVSRLRRHWETCFPRSVVGRPGLEETLSALHARGMRLGIVTNGEVRFQEPKIAQLSIGRYLSTVVISEAVQMQKPDPRIFAHALAEIGCAALHTWFVGDHPINDVLGAAAVGLRPIWLTGVQPWAPAYPAPTWQIAALGELVTMAQRANHAP